MPLPTTSQPFDWKKITEETCEQRLEALWPACDMRRPNMFLLGEAYDSDDAGTQRYLAHLKDSDGHWEGSRPVTRAEFFQLARR